MRIRYAQWVQCTRIEEIGIKQNRSWGLNLSRKKSKNDIAVKRRLLISCTFRLPLISSCFYSLKARIIGDLKNRHLTERYCWGRTKKNGKDGTPDLSSLLPAACVVKNTMTIYTLFVVLIAMMIAFPLFYAENGLLVMLANFAQLKHPAFVYAVGFYIFATYCGTYPLLSQEMVWSKDDNLRAKFIYPVCVIFVATIILYVKGTEVFLWEAVLNVMIARQLYGIINLSFSVYYSTVNGPVDKYYATFHASSGRLDLGKIISFYLKIFFAMCLSILIFTILLAVAIIPLSLSFLNLNELEKLSIYGFLFPVIRYLCGLLFDFFVNLMDKAGLFKGNPQGLTNFKFVMSLSTALFFAISPLFCMMFLSSDDPLAFAITYVPHAFFSKLMWVRHIPQVKAYFANFFCFISIPCLGKKRVVPQENATDNFLSEEERVKNGENRKEEENIIISKIGGIQEAADLFGIKMAIILMVMRLCSLCFFQKGSSNNSGLSFDQLKFLFINVFCIILPIDQITAILGFALLAKSGYPVDANFHLDVNPLNPIRTWRNGNRFKAIGSLSFCVCGCLSIFCAIAIGTNGPLF